MAPDERIKNSKKRKGYGEKWSYRLIDFGSSRYVEVDGSDKELDAEYHRLKTQIAIHQDRFFE